MDALIGLGIIIAVIVVSGGIFFLPLGLNWLGESIANSTIGGKTPVLNGHGQPDSFESWE